ncbi:hypothetical protein TI04_03460 [Achromatium sp. WMS2]|nr:hypothetical protein TI04_03460 [Achromatium sp. WMS2]
MTASALTTSGPGVFTITGVVDFSSVDSLLGISKTMFIGHNHITVDCGGVTLSNSAGLALLLEWQDWAQQRGQLLHIRNLPPALADIARMSNCLQLLHVIDG